MNSTKIKLSGIPDAVIFVSAAEKCNFDIDVRFNSIIIDGKSIMGVCSLDLSHILTITYDGNNPTFEQMLEKFSLDL